MLKNKYSTRLTPLKVKFKPAAYAALTAFHVAAYAPRPAAKVAAVDCTGTAPLTKPPIAPAVKRCSKCGASKPLHEFFRNDGLSKSRRAICKPCDLHVERLLQEKARAKTLAKLAPARKRYVVRACDAVGADDEDQDLFYLTTKGGPVDLDVLNRYARSMPGTRIVFTCGVTRVDAVYDGNDFDYASGSWPVDVEFVARVFDHLNSGHAAGGFW